MGKVIIVKGKEGQATIEQLFPSGYWLVTGWEYGYLRMHRYDYLADARRGAKALANGHPDQWPY